MISVTHGEENRIHSDKANEWENEHESKIDMQVCFGYCPFRAGGFYERLPWCSVVDCFSDGRNGSNDQKE